MTNREKHIIKQVDEVAKKIGIHYSKYHLNKESTPELESFREILVGIQMIKDINDNYIILQ